MGDYTIKQGYFSKTIIKINKNLFVSRLLFHLLTNLWTLNKLSLENVNQTFSQYMNSQIYDILIQCRPLSCGDWGPNCGLGGPQLNYFIDNIVTLS